jgi:hypothetical protein
MAFAPTAQGVVEEVEVVVEAAAAAAAAQFVVAEAQAVVVVVTMEKAVVSGSNISWLAYSLRVSACVYAPLSTCNVWLATRSYRARICVGICGRIAHDP